MNTGHDGSLTTVHANAPRDALSRIENMVAMAGLDMPMSATRRQIASGIHVVIQMQRMEDGKRRLISLQEIDGMEGETVRMSEIFAFRRTGMDSKGGVLGYFHASGIVPAFHERLMIRGIHLDPHLFDPNRRVE
jgi:pilus assembly protein CpaF